MRVPETDPLSQLSLPPGFRFYPTDEELLVQYLCRKVAGHQFSLQIIGEIDLYKFDPWVLPSKAIFGEKEWYFFSPRDRKYPNGSRPNRVAGSGYWKATGTDKVIMTEGRKVGIKKALVFYIGKAPKGSKTNWIMHEYRLFEPSRKTGSAKLDEWVLCRIYKKNSSSAQKVPMSSPSITGQEQSYNSSSSSSSHLDDVLESLPEIEDRFFSLPRMNSLKTLQNGLGSGNFDWATLAGLTSEPELLNAGQQSQSHQTQGMMVNNNNNNNNNNCSNDVYVPSIPPMCNVDSQPQKLRNKVEEEAQSGLRTQQHQQQQQQQAAANSGLFQQNSNIFNQSFPNSFDSFGFRYPTQSNGFGLFPQ